MLESDSWFSKPWILSPEVCQGHFVEGHGFSLYYLLKMVSEGISCDPVSLNSLIWTCYLGWIYIALEWVSVLLENRTN